MILSISLDKFVLSITSILYIYLKGLLILCIDTTGGFLRVRTIGGSENTVVEN